MEPSSHPRAGTVRIVDGNVLAGVLGNVLGDEDVTVRVVACRSCGMRAPLATWVVEVDRDAFIVRCRSCTRTLWTVLRSGEDVVLLSAEDRDRG